MTRHLDFLVETTDQFTRSVAADLRSANIQGSVNPFEGCHDSPKKQLKASQDKTEEVIPQKS